MTKPLRHQLQVLFLEFGPVEVFDRLYTLVTEQVEHQPEHAETLEKIADLLEAATTHASAIAESAEGDLWR